MANALQAQPHTQTDPKQLVVMTHANPSSSGGSPLETVPIGHHTTENSLFSVITR